MARGEFESLVALQKYIPDNVPKPVALGPLQDGTITKCYFVVEFKDMLALKPSPQATASVLSRLHHMSESPNGKFGFPVTTYKGYFPVNNDWCDTWEAWFSREFAQTLRNYYLRRGEDCELVHLYSEFSDKIIPRLLRPLETGGRSIKPTLCHTDLWHGNAAVGRETQECIIFDPCCLYVDLGFFRTEKYGWNTAYIEEYAKLMQPSEPQADFDDRIAVYAMRNYIVSATLWDHWLHMMDQ
ncbi:Fructosamine/Ketosamine-3-kinase [Coniochaeta sp. 2T2.1]|nr:Fructosamine/Ketosamine-3-kinase [Coniochaeta sp. 2T2.1]